MSVKKLVYQAQNVSFSYGKNPVIDGVTVDIHEGDYLGIIGPNGGGKTTFLKILLGILEPTEGSVKLFGERARVGYVPQRSSAIGEAFPATVEEIVMSGRTPLQGVLQTFNKKDKEKADRAMVVAGIDHLRKRRVGTLSGGERQRTLIARALAAEPKVLILDEPTSAVDVAGQEEIYDFLRELKKKLKLTIILVSHDADIISHEVDQVLCLNRHLVCHGPAEEIMRHPHITHGHH